MLHKDKINYEVIVKIGALQNTPTSSRTYLTLIDHNGHREERQLIPRSGFAPGQVRKRF